MKFRWLGVAGIELNVGGEILVIDPYFTRAPFRNLLFGRISPDAQLIHKYLPVCSYVMVTHAHFAHVMDAAVVLLTCSAQGYGSLNACCLMTAMGAPVEYVHRISGEEHLNWSFSGVHHQQHPYTNRPLD
jgi:L-ascorbate metabolism protein UlaG (beta-lactamase superfamily)